jgi:hypothetical protein
MLTPSGSAEKLSIWIGTRFQNTAKFGSIGQRPVKNRSITRIGNRVKTISGSLSAATSGVVQAAGEPFSFFAIKLARSHHMVCNMQFSPKKAINEKFCLN